MRKLALTLALTCLAGTASAQSTWFVDITGNAPGTGTALDPYTSIDFALNQSSTLSGDTVLVAPGTYAENVTFNAKGVLLMSTDGPRATVIDGNGNGSAVSFIGTDGTTMELNGFTLTGGVGTTVASAPRGGGVYGLDAIVDLRGCAIINNDATQGAGLYLDNCVTRMRRVLIRGNFSQEFNDTTAGGGLYMRDGTAVLRRCSIERNHAGTPNTPGSGGGVFTSGSADLTLESCQVLDNTGERNGGGMSAAATINNSLFAGNRSQFGGAIAGSAVVSNSLFEDNTAISATGTSHFGGAVSGGTYTQCTFRNNTAVGEGSAAHQATLLDCQVHGNDSVASGSRATGALETCTAMGCDITDNRADGVPSAPAYGGGASNSDLIDCDVSMNSAASQPPSGLPSLGGGAFGGTLTDCRVFDNTSFDGGGVAFARVDRSELWGNLASNLGSAAYDSHLDRVTVAANLNLTTLSDGVHVENSGSITNSILRFNLNNLVVAPGATFTATYSNIEGGWPGTGNIDADPLFWDSSNNDYNLMAGSPCIDAGDPNSTPDPDGSPADMGANPFDPAYTGS